MNNLFPKISDQKSNQVFVQIINDQKRWKSDASKGGKNYKGNSDSAYKQTNKDMVVAAGQSAGKQLPAKQTKQSRAYVISGSIAVPDHQFPAKRIGAGNASSVASTYIQRMPVKVCYAGNRSDKPTSTVQNKQRKIINEDKLPSGQTVFAGEETPFGQVTEEQWLATSGRMIQRNGGTPRGQYLDKDERDGRLPPDISENPLDKNMLAQKTHENWAKNNCFAKDFDIVAQGQRSQGDFFNRRKRSSQIQSSKPHEDRLGSKQKSKVHEGVSQAGTRLGIQGGDNKSVTSGSRAANPQGSYLNHKLNGIEVTTPIRLYSKQDTSVRQNSQCHSAMNGKQQDSSKQGQNDQDIRSRYQKGASYHSARKLSDNQIQTNSYRLNRSSIIKIDDAVQPGGLISAELDVNISYLQNSFTVRKEATEPRSTEKAPKPSSCKKLPPVTLKKEQVKFQQQLSPANRFRSSSRSVSRQKDEQKFTTFNQLSIPKKESSENKKGNIFGSISRGENVQTPVKFGADSPEAKLRDLQKDLLKSPWIQSKNQRNASGQKSALNREPSSGLLQSSVTNKKTANQALVTMGATSSKKKFTIDPNFIESQRKLTNQENTVSLTKIEKEYYDEMSRQRQTNKLLHDPEPQELFTILSANQMLSDFCEIISELEQVCVVQDSKYCETVPKAQQVLETTMQHSTYQVTVSNLHKQKQSKDQSPGKKKKFTEKKSLPFEPVINDSTIYTSHLQNLAMTVSRFLSRTNKTADLSKQDIFQRNMVQKLNPYYQHVFQTLCNPHSSSILCQQSTPISSMAAGLPAGVPADKMRAPYFQSYLASLSDNLFRKMIVQVRQIYFLGDQKQEADGNEEEDTVVKKKPKSKRHRDRQVLTSIDTGQKSVLAKVLLECHIGHVEDQFFNKVKAQRLKTTSKFKDKGWQGGQGEIKNIDWIMAAENSSSGSVDAQTKSIKVVSSTDCRQGHQGEQLRKKLKKDDSEDTRTQIAKDYALQLDRYLDERKQKKLSDIKAVYNYNLPIKKRATRQLAQSNEAKDRKDLAKNASPLRSNSLEQSQENNLLHKDAAPKFIKEAEWPKKPTSVRLGGTTDSYSLLDKLKPEKQHNLSMLPQIPQRNYSVESKGELADISRISNRHSSFHQIITNPHSKQGSEEQQTTLYGAAKLELMSLSCLQNARKNTSKFVLSKSVMSPHHLDSMNLHSNLILKNKQSGSNPGSQLNPQSLPGSNFKHFKSTQQENCMNIQHNFNSFTQSQRNLKADFPQDVSHPKINLSMSQPKDLCLSKQDKAINLMQNHDQLKKFLGKIDPIDADVIRGVNTGRSAFGKKEPEITTVKRRDTDEQTREASKLPGALTYFGEEIRVDESSIQDQPPSQPILQNDQNIKDSKPTNKAKRRYSNQENLDTLIINEHQEQLDMLLPRPGRNELTSTSGLMSTIQTVQQKNTHLIQLDGDQVHKCFKQLQNSVSQGRQNESERSFSNIKYRHTREDLQANVTQDAPYTQASIKKETLVLNSQDYQKASLVSRATEKPLRKKKELLLSKDLKCPETIVLKAGIHKKISKLLEQSKQTVQAKQRQLEERMQNHQIHTKMMKSGFVVAADYANQSYYRSKGEKRSTSSAKRDQKLIKKHALTMVQKKVQPKDLANFSPYTAHLYMYCKPARTTIGKQSKGQSKEAHPIKRSDSQLSKTSQEYLAVSQHEKSIDYKSVPKNKFIAKK